MAAGIDLPQFFQGGGLATPITHVEADFRSPLQIGDRPVVHLNAELEEIATFRITYQIQLEGTVVATALTRHVCINPSTRARVSLPPELLSWLKSVQQEQILRTAMP
jgi:1,4-dihydroxy-2-naphthoyl-CoA hydrolase